MRGGFFSGLIKAERENILRTFTDIHRLKANRMACKRKQKEHGFLQITRILVLMIGFMFLGLSIASEDEIGQLGEELASSGYDWLADYDLSYSAVEVFGWGNDGGSRELNVYKIRTIV